MNLSLKEILGNDHLAYLEPEYGELRQSMETITSDNWTEFICQLDSMYCSLKQAYHVGDISQEELQELKNQILPVRHIIEKFYCAPQIF